jgi:hypothetical protein
MAIGALAGVADVTGVASGFMWFLLNSVNDPDGPS